MSKWKQPAEYGVPSGLKYTGANMVRQQVSSAGTTNPVMSAFINVSLSSSCKERV
jgi:hypothetical protein